VPLRAGDYARAMSTAKRAGSERARQWISSSRGPLRWSAAAAALACAAPAVVGQAESAGPWTALPLPALAQPATPAALVPRLETGRCLLGPRDALGVRELRAPAVFEAEDVLGLLRDEVAARGLAVELHPSAPPLLARGAPEQVDVLRGILDELDALGRSLDVALSVWIAPPDGQPFSAVAGREPDFRAVLRSGQSISFGGRTVASFLTGYAAEVATDSGVADPVLSRAQLGRVLHVRPCRVRGGRAVHLECLFEAAELEPGAPPFDPGTPDLGLLEQPAARFAQVRYSDVVESGAASSFTLDGSPDHWADATVWIRAETSPDPVPSTASGEASWRGLDLALLEYRTFDLALPLPGAGLDEAGGESAELGVLCEAFPAAQVALAAEPAGRRRPGPMWTPGYLLLPPGGGAWESASSVVAALESERLEAARLSVSQGTLRVDLPTTRGQPARVLVGRETLRLVDYETHVAAESWMPVPIVAPVFDGLCLQGHLDGAGLRGLAWVSETRGARVLERADVGVGRLQLLERGFQSCPIALDPGPPGDGAGGRVGASVLSLHSTSPGLTVELHSR